MDKKEGDVNPQTTSLTLIEKALSDPNIDPAKLQQLLDVKKDWEADEALKLFNTDMHACQVEMPVVVKDAVNTGIGNKYARLETVAKAIKPVYTAHGFSISYSEEPSNREDWLTVILILRHTGNHVEKYRRYAPIDDKGPKGGDVKTKLHGAQSSMSYMQRQLLCSTFGVTVADDDNDGNTGKPPPAFITQDQADEIEKYIGNQPDPEGCKARILKLCQCETIESMKSNWYPVTIKKLKAGLST